MIELRDKQSGKLIGNLNDEQLQFLIDHLEEESSSDQDYYLNGPTLDMLEESGGDPHLVSMLRRALGERDDLEIYWSRQE